jgi:hypothetical protein
MIRISDQARENREYVRRLLKEKQPGFAALLEPVERLLCPMCPGERCFLAAAQGSPAGCLTSVGLRITPGARSWAATLTGVQTRRCVRPRSAGS